MYTINFHHHFDGMPSSQRSEEIEKLIEKAIKKYNRSNVTKTKVQALLEEIYGYWLRSRELFPDICDFTGFIQHWTESHRGIIPDAFLAEIEKQFGVLEGPLYLRRGHSYWNTSRDWREYDPAIDNQGEN